MALFCRSYDKSNTSGRDTTTHYLRNIITSPPLQLEFLFHIKAFFFFLHLLLPLFPRPNYSFSSSSTSSSTPKAKRKLINEAGRPSNGSRSSKMTTRMAAATSTLPTQQLLNTTDVTPYHIGIYPTRHHVVHATRHRWRRKPECE